MFLIALSILAFLFFLWSFFRLKKVVISFFVGFVLFFSIQYGPHTIALNEMMRMAVPGAVSRDIENIYALVMIMVYLLLGLLFLITPASILNLRGRAGGEAFSVMHYKKTILVMSILFILLSAGLQGGASIFITHLKFMTGDSSFSYKEIRRELFTDTAWSSVADLLRYTILPIIGGFLFLIFLKTKGGIRYFYLIMAGAVPLFCAIQLNKLFYFYYASLYIFLFLCERKLKCVPEIKTHLGLSKSLKLIFGGLAVMTLIFYLYSFQYSTELDQGILTTDRIIGTQIYRIFLTSSDGIRLWIDYFMERFEPNGISSIGKVCSVFGECLNSNIIIPRFYLGEDLTTIQTGFIGSGLSFGGLIAVPLFTVFAYLLVILNNYVLARFLGGDISYIFAGTALINSLFLTTRELATAMISGGVLVIPLIAVCLLLQRRIRRRAQGSLNVRPKVL